jgi:hypothetical protein
MNTIENPIFIRYNVHQQIIWRSIPYVMAISIRATQFGIRYRGSQDSEEGCGVKMLKRKERNRRCLRNESAYALDKHGKVRKLRESLMQIFQSWYSYELFRD